MTACDQVAEVAEFLALDETLIDHPVVVIHFRKIFVSAIADESDHALGLLLRLGSIRRAAATSVPEEDPPGFPLSSELARDFKALSVRDRVGRLHAREIADRGKNDLPTPSTR